MAVNFHVREISIALSTIFLLLSPASAETVKTEPPISSAPVVFFDIAGPDTAKLKGFYSENFGWAIDSANGITTLGLKGTIRQDPAETLIYLGVSDIDAALKKIVASGGTVVLPRTVVPKVVTFALFKDPAGNRMGLVETGK